MPLGLALAFLAYFNGGVIQDGVFRLASLGPSVNSEELDRGDQDLPCWLKKIIKLSGQE